MEVGWYRKPIELNPQLEALRAKGLQENALESNEWILKLVEKTARIHAGFLFEDPKTLQKICLFISESQNKITDAGWEVFGYHLGLSPSILRVINHNNFNREDPCYNTLLAYVQHENASIGKILEALLMTGRLDVLTRIKDSVNELADMILQCQSNGNINTNSVEETSDYESLPNSESNPNTSNIFTFSSSELIIRPKVIPPAPFIFKNIQATPEITSQQIKQALDTVTQNDSAESLLSYESDKNNYNNNNIGCILSQKIVCNENFVRNESLQTSSVPKHSKENFEPSKKQKYGIKILLTFAEDGEKYIKEICRIFRKKHENYPPIGVLVLSEHISKVNKDPQQFIIGAFQQVDYVCPVLTTGYFDLITKKQKASSLSNIHIDASFVPYIYKLMNSYFTSNECLNDKVRCIIPDSEFSYLLYNFLMTNPIFGAWVKSSEVEELAKRLLKSTFCGFPKPC